MIKRGSWPLALLLLLAASAPAGAAVVSVGAFPEPNPAPPISIPADTFLVPVLVSGALQLQSWQFDLQFDNTVVEVVDPLDGSSGLYGAEFTPGDASSTSFILGGFPLNALGLVDDVAGSYPGLLDGVSGDGVLSYILFRFLPGQESGDPGFSIANAVTQEPVPMPGAVVLLAAGMAVLSMRRRGVPRPHKEGSRGADHGERPLLRDTVVGPDAAECHPLHRALQLRQPGGARSRDRHHLGADAGHRGAGMVVRVRGHVEHLSTWCVRGGAGPDLQ